jgi:hypothetical protein
VHARPTFVYRSALKRRDHMRSTPFAVAGGDQFHYATTSKAALATGGIV